MEKWKAVNGTEEKIWVSNYGRVKSLLRDERILKQQKDSKGYMRITVTIGGQKKTYKVHRIVAEAFLPNLDMKPQVNHINGNKCDNRSENLEWVTNSENCKHAINTGLWNSVISGSLKENESRKKPVIATNDLTGEVIRFESVAEAERFIGSRHVSAVLKGKRSKAKGYHFEYERGWSHGNTGYSRT